MRLDSPTVESLVDGPVRTCVGCRQRAAKRELLRVTLGEGTEEPGGTRAVVPDPGGSAPGRGAHLHPTSACLELAERRRAFPRALKHRGPAALSLDAVREHLRQLVTDQ